MDDYILIVEDEKDIRETLVNVVDMLGYHARSAANGREAIAMLAERPLPRLILLDLMMPVMNGEEFRRQQMSDPELAAIPVVIVSADWSVFRKAAALGVSDAILKPIDLDLLANTVERYYKVA
jgi:CheY-like chemotaxis protein